MIEILSRQLSDEIYLGDRDNDFWTSDQREIESFQKFGRKLVEIEENITTKNNDSSFKNQYGPVKMPYTLVLRSSDEGLSFISLFESVCACLVSLICCL